MGMFVFGLSLYLLHSKLRFEVGLLLLVSSARTETHSQEYPKLAHFTILSYNRIKTVSRRHSRMYRVALCENNPEQSDTQFRICHDIFERASIESEISVFPDNESIHASFFQNENRYDLILMDIDLTDKNGNDRSGLDLAREICQTDNDVAIIFITDYPHFAIEAHGVNTLDFLTKDVDVQRLEDAILYNYSRKFYTLTYREKNRYKSIPFKDIVYLDKAIGENEVKLSLIDGSTEYYRGSLTGLLSFLPNWQFGQCHKKFAVNFDYVRSFTRSEIMTVNGKISMGRKYYPNFERRGSGK